MKVSSALIVLLAVASPSTSAYSFDDPEASHTNQAIKFDGEGRREDSLRAFQAAVRFGEGSEAYANLAVCLMRLGTATSDRDQKVTWYHKAHAAMQRAREMAGTSKEIEHVQENTKALKQSMNAESVSEPDVALDPMEGALGSGKKRRKKRRSYYSTTIDDDEPEDDSPYEGTLSASTAGAGVGGVARASPQRSQQRAHPHRERLLHQRDVPLAPPLPRVSPADLDSGLPEFELYRQRKVPFILTGALEGWGALDNWCDTGTLKKRMKEAYPGCPRG